MKDEFIKAYTSYLFDELGDSYIDADIGIDGFKKKCLESAEKVYNFLNANYSHIHLPGAKPCASLAEFATTHFGNMDNLIKYLLTSQDGYAVSTIESFDMFPEILGYNVAIGAGYRHAYITVFAPPIDDKNMVIEWSRHQTEENLQKRVQARFQTNTPGIVILGLIAADNKLKASQNYTLDKYIPWKNDCHTYILHVQQKMNELLPVEFRQKTITLPCHVGPDAPLEKYTTTKKNIENYPKRIRADRDIDVPAETQLSHITNFFKPEDKEKEDDEKKPPYKQHGPTFGSKNNS